MALKDTVPVAPDNYSLTGKQVILYDPTAPADSDAVRLDVSDLPTGATAEEAQAIADNAAAISALQSATPGTPTPAFTVLSGTVWDGSNKELILTTNKVLTLSATPARGGILLVQQDNTGGRTVTLQGVSLAVSSAANSVTLFVLEQRADGSLFVDKSANYLSIPAPAGPDVTAPVVVSAYATDANTITVTMNEAATSAATGFVFTRAGVSLTNSAVAGSGTNTLAFTIAETLAGVDVITYANGSTTVTDASGNAMATGTTGSVINNIVTASFVVWDKEGGVTEATPYDLLFPNSAAHSKTPLKLTGVGAITIELTSLIDGMVLGFNSDPGFSDYQSTIKSGVFFYSNAAYIQENTVPATGTASSVSYGSAQFFRLRRDSNNKVWAEISNDSGATWLSLYQSGGVDASLPATQTGDLYAKAFGSGLPAGGGEIKNAKYTGAWA